MSDKMLSISELEDLVEKAESMARTPMMHPLWKRGYQRLADAADYLSLLNLRATVNEISNSEGKADG